MTQLPIELACEVAVLRALDVAGKKCKNNRSRAVRAQYADMPTSELYRKLYPPIDETEHDKLMLDAWEQLRAVIVTDHPAVVDRIITACDTYVRALLTSREPHQREVLRQYLAVACEPAT